MTGIRAWYVSHNREPQHRREQQNQVVRSLVAAWMCYRERGVAATRLEGFDVVRKKVRRIVADGASDVNMREVSVFHLSASAAPLSMRRFVGADVIEILTITIVD